MELFPLFQTHLSKIEISHHTANPNLQRQPCVSVSRAIVHLSTFLCVQICFSHDENIFFTN